MIEIEPDPYGAILRAARWAERHSLPTPADPDALELARALAEQANHKVTDHEAILLALRPMVEAWRAT